MTPTFAASNRVFICAAALRVVDLPVSFRTLQTLASAAKVLRSSLSDSAHSLLSQQVEQLDYLVRGLVSTVVPFSNFLAGRTKEVDGIVSKSTLLERTGAFKQEQIALRKCIELLKEESTNPLLTVILEEISTSPIDGSRCIILPIPGLLPEAKAYFETLESPPLFEVSHPYTLRGISFFEQIVLVGPPHWYTRMNWTFESPRSASIVCAHYDWFKIGRPTVERFINQNDSGAKADEYKQSAIAISVEGESELPETNWDAVAQSGESEYLAYGSTQQGNVEARLYALAEGHAVFLEAKDDRHELVIDLDLLNVQEMSDENDDEGIISRLPIGDLQPGHLILLRTEGGSDAIETYADKRIGSSASKIRERLNTWKELFRRSVENAAHESILIDRLVQAGAVHANLINIKNWCSPNTIKPRDQRDFNAIMAVITKGNDADALWREALLVDSNHRHAGHAIRRELLQIVKSVDLQMLAEKGIMTFTLPGGGSLTAFRIEDIETRPRQVSPAVLHKPFVVSP